MQMQQGSRRSDVTKTAFEAVARGFSAPRVELMERFVGSRLS